MAPGLEAVAAEPAAPSLMAAALRMGLAVLALAALGGGWIYWQNRLRRTRSHLQVLDRAMLARGSSVALLRVEGRRLLVGVSAEGVRLLRDLDAGAQAATASGGGGPSFPALLDEAAAKREPER